MDTEPASLGAKARLNGETSRGSRDRDKEEHPSKQKKTFLNKKTKSLVIVLAVVLLVLIPNLSIALSALSQAKKNKVRTETGTAHIGCTKDGHSYCDSGFCPSLCPKNNVPVKPEKILVKFQKSFASPPKVTDGVSSLDLFNGHFPFDTSVEEVTTTGFTLAVHTWGGTVIGGLSFSWVAIG